MRFALRRSAASARVEVSVAGDVRSTTATHSFVHCAKPRSQPCLRSFYRSTDHSTSFHHRPVDEETKLRLPLCEAPCLASASTSTTNYWSFSAPYIHTQLRSLAHHVSDCELPIPHDRTAMALFSAARSTSPPNPRSRLSDELGRGSRSSGCHVVVVVSLFALLGRCVVQRSTERRLFFVFQSRVASPRTSRSPA